MEFAHGHPINDKPALAEWMGYPSVEAMDADHDDLHVAIANFFDLPSFSIRKACGHDMTEQQEQLAACEEAAVLHLQRWLQWMRNAGVS